MIYSLFALLVLLNVADAWTTYRILRNGGYEVNPKMVLVFRKLGLVGGLIGSKLSALSIVLLFIQICEYATPILGVWVQWVAEAFLAGWCLWYLKVVCHNVREMV